MRARLSTGRKSRQPSAVQACQRWGGVALMSVSHDDNLPGVLSGCLHPPFFRGDRRVRTSAWQCDSTGAAGRKCLARPGQGTGGARSLRLPADPLSIRPRRQRTHTHTRSSWFPDRCAGEGEAGRNSAPAPSCHIHAYEARAAGPPWDSLSQDGGVWKLPKTSAWSRM